MTCTHTRDTSRWVEDDDWYPLKNEIAANCIRLKNNGNDVIKSSPNSVRECANIVEHSRIQGDEGVCLVGATKNKIKQHFGVEE